MTRTVRWPVFEVIRFALSRDLRRICGVLMKKWFVFILCLWGFQASAKGTYTAASCNFSDIQAAYNSEQATPVDGDVISIPAGNCTWTGSPSLVMSFTTSVMIQGAGAISATANGAGTTGTDNTIITDHYSSTNSLWVLSCAAGKTCTALVINHENSRGDFAFGSRGPRRGVD